MHHVLDIHFLTFAIKDHLNYSFFTNCFTFFFLRIPKNFNIFFQISFFIIYVVLLNIIIITKTNYLFILKIYGIIKGERKSKNESFIIKITKQLS
jgi:hypothetical protein